MNIYFIDRKTKKRKQEKVYGHFFLKLLYGHRRLQRFVSKVLLPCVAHVPFLSRLYGTYQKSGLTKRKVLPFIRDYAIDTSEFLEPVEAFSSFNDFFIRKLKAKCRPIAKKKDVAILPADARYLVFPHIEEASGFWVKGKKFSLSELLQDDELTRRYAKGAMVIARLCPVDYHRFHFPCECVPGSARLLNGPLFSVNPIALKKNIEILAENKRMLTELKTEDFGTILYLEIGATYVGSIEQTYTPGKVCAKGEEKGYFAFGGSCLILLFEPGRMTFDKDLVAASAKKIEVYGQLGQSLGKFS